MITKKVDGYNHDTVDSALQFRHKVRLNFVYRKCPLALELTTANVLTQIYTGRATPFPGTEVFQQKNLLFRDAVTKNTPF